jgi:hypothetical protein
MAILILLVLSCVSLYGEEVCITLKTGKVLVGDVELPINPKLDVLLQVQFGRVRIPQDKIESIRSSKQDDISDLKQNTIRTRAIEPKQEKEQKPEVVNESTKPVIDPNVEKFQSKLEKQREFQARKNELTIYRNKLMEEVYEKGIRPKNFSDKEAEIYKKNKSIFYHKYIAGKSLDYLKTKFLPELRKKGDNRNLELLFTAYEYDYDLKQ